MYKSQLIRHILIFLIWAYPFQMYAQPKGGAKLIVRGDDIGFAQSANEAILKASLEGIQTSVEIMPTTPWFPQAIAMLKANPQIDVGIHLTLTSEWENLKWGPLTQAPSLVDSNGYFYPFIWPNQNYPGQNLKDKPWKLQEIEKEFRAQIERVLTHLPWASHISAHMGCTGLSDEVRAVAELLAREYDLHIDLKELGVEGVRYNGPSKTSEEKKASFIAMLKSLQPGKTYLFVDHPAFDTPELRQVYHIGYTDVAQDRQGVTDIWTDPQVKVTIRELGIELISYKDLKK